MASEKVQKKIISDNGLLQPQYGADIALSNQTLSNLVLDRVFTWSGTPTNPGFPENIPADGSAEFTYIRGIEDGSIAAVIYSSENKSVPYSFVVAWDAPADNTPTPNRVYVNCAPKDVIDGYTFATIRQYLSVSGKTSGASDILSKTAAFAEIDDLQPNIATVRANIVSVLP